MTTASAFDLDELLADCRASLAETDPRRAIRDVIQRAMTQPGAVADALQPQTGGFTLLHHSPDLTVLHVVWAPGMRIYPHDHRMWATIGIYAGREDNAFYRRATDDRGTLVESGGKRLEVGDVVDPRRRHHPQRGQHLRRAHRRDPRVRRRLRQPAPQPMGTGTDARAPLRRRPGPAGVRGRQPGLARRRRDTELTRGRPTHPIERPGHEKGVVHRIVTESVADAAPPRSVRQTRHMWRDSSALRDVSGAETRHDLVDRLEERGADDRRRFDDAAT